jgi:hypothetical protein
MNIFILSTGRCGSETFVKACEHLSNFSVGHETRCTCLGKKRLEYPQNHIESDNRLTWFLGRLDHKYGDDAYYVHLFRDRESTANSYMTRWKRGYGIMQPYYKGILRRDEQRHAFPREQTYRDVCLDYVDTVTENIELFLKDKKNTMKIPLSEAETKFSEFLEWIGAKGNLESAISEWTIAHNKTKGHGRSVYLRAALKARRAWRKFPEYLWNV